MDGGEGNEAHEVGEELVVSGCDPPEVFEFIEEALDAVALFVDVFVVVVLIATIALGRDDRRGLGVQDAVMEAIGIIGTVGQDIVGFKSLDQVIGAADVALLPWTTDQADRIAKTVGGGMDLSAQPASGPAKALGIRPPFSLRAPAAC